MNRALGLAILAAIAAISACLPSQPAPSQPPLSQSPANPGYRVTSRDLSRSRCDEAARLVAVRYPSPRISAMDVVRLDLCPSSCPYVIAQMADKASYAAWVTVHRGSATSAYRVIVFKDGRIEVKPPGEEQ